MWTDLIQPRVTVSPRYTTKIAVLKSSAMLVDHLNDRNFARPAMKDT